MLKLGFYNNIFASLNLRNRCACQGRLFTVSREYMWSSGEKILSGLFASFLMIFCVLLICLHIELFFWLLTNSPENSPWPVVMENKVLNRHISIESQKINIRLRCSLMLFCWLSNWIWLLGYLKAWSAESLKGFSVLVSGWTFWLLLILPTSMLLSIKFLWDNQSKIPNNTERDGFA